MMPSRVYTSRRQVCLFDCRSVAYPAPESDLGTKGLTKLLSKGEGQRKNGLENIRDEKNLHIFYIHP